MHSVMPAGPAWPASCFISACMAGINFIFDRDVRSDLRVNIAVRNTAIEDAVRLLLATHQLEQKPLNDNTIPIYPTACQDA